MAAAAAIWTSSRSAWPLWSAASQSWNPALAAEAASLAHQAASAKPDAVADALDRESRRRLGQFLAGIETYRAHPHRRDLADPPAIWSEETTRLLDYGGGRKKAAGATVLVVPSLVNRAYVLDLDRNVSMMRFLAQRGLRPLLVDWGAPGALERGFDLTDYIGGRLARALDAARKAAGRKVALLGYCMGGLLTLALAQLRPRDVTGIAFLATPWDFHAGTGGPHPVLTSFRPALTALIDAFGELPVDVLQALFFSLDPLQSWIKFRGFAALDPDSDAAQRFAALEDWANDGVALAGPVARECLFGWYGDNTPAAGQWRLSGQAIRPEALRLPTLHAIPARDRIVPPDSSRALAQAVPGARILTPNAGHVGMAVGSRAERELWAPVADWLAAL